MQENDNTEQEHGADWIDFKALKATLEVRPVLAHFGILEHLETKGAELVGWCPLGKQHGKQDSFSFNVEKRSFQCFACRARGSVLDFITKHENVSLREAGKIAVTIGGINDTTLHGNDNKTTTDTRPYGKPAPQSNTENQNNGLATSKSDNKTTDKKRKRGSDHLPLFTWQQAQELIDKKQLDPDKLLIVDTDNLADWLASLANPKTTASKSKT